MESYNIHAAKTHLSKLIEEALKGKDIVISRNGEPMVHLTPCKKESTKKPRMFGQWKDKHVWISPDFDEPDPELEKLFYDGPLFPEEGTES